jgi:hypothetical protein
MIVTGRLFLAYGGVVDQWEGYWVALQRDGTPSIEDGWRWLDGRPSVPHVITCCNLLEAGSSYVTANTPWEAAEPNSLAQGCAWAGYTGTCIAMLKPSV